MAITLSQPGFLGMRGTDDWTSTEARPMDWNNKLIDLEI